MNKRRSLLVAGLFAMLPHGLVQAQDKTALVLGTATPGGGFPLYGAAFAETVNDADTSLLVQPRNTKGSEHSFDRSRAARHRTRNRGAALRGGQWHRPCSSIRGNDELTQESVLWTTSATFSIKSLLSKRRPVVNIPLTLALSPQAGRGNTLSPVWAGEGRGRSRGFSRHADCLRSGSPMQRTARTASEGGKVSQDSCNTRS
jgi:hypothetical protein